MVKKKTISPAQKKLDSTTKSKTDIQITVDEGARDVIRNLFSSLYSTGTMMGGTIGSLNQKVEYIEHLLVQPDYQQKFSLIEGELITIKTEILPQLEQSKQTIAKVEEYMRNNASFLTDLLSSEGRLRSLESEVLSLTKRLDKMQSEKSLAWNRTTTVISIIIAIIGTVFGVYFGFLR